MVLDIDATLVHTHGDVDDFKMLDLYSGLGGPLKHFYKMVGRF